MQKNKGTKPQTKATTPTCPQRWVPLGFPKQSINSQTNTLTFKRRLVYGSLKNTGTNLFHSLCSPHITLDAHAKAWDDPLPPRFYRDAAAMQRRKNLIFPGLVRAVETIRLISGEDDFVKSPARGDAQLLFADDFVPEAS